jgi:hypothetical protein
MEGMEGTEEMAGKGMGTEEGTEGTEGTEGRVAAVEEKAVVGTNS